MTAKERAKALAKTLLYAAPEMWEFHIVEAIQDAVESETKGMAELVARVETVYAQLRDAPPEHKPHIAKAFASALATSTRSEG